MDWPTTILVIVMIGAVTSTIQAFITRQRAPAADPADQARSLRMAEEMEALRDRVAVLERIATERNTLLDQQFEQLRGR